MFDIFPLLHSFLLSYPKAVLSRETARLSYAENVHSEALPIA